MPSAHSLQQQLEDRGVSRRDFMQYCGVAAAVLGLPATAAGEIADALETKAKPTVIWLEFQDCTGDSEAFLRASRPTAAEVILDLISVDYHETLMAAAGHQAEAARDGVVASKKGEYIVIVEGSIPTGAGGGYCTIGGKSAQQIADEVCKNALAVIAVGSCAAFGGLPAAAPNPTDAKSVGDAVSGIKTLINLPACPINGENLVAVIAYFLTYGKWPATDRYHRPLFAHGKILHDNCERRAHFDAGQYVEQFGDEAHRLGYCLFKVGCKGPVTYHNCPNIGWNETQAWPVGCGHPCIGCSEPDFWDKHTPFYKHLTGIPGFGAAADIDKIGLYATAAVAVGFTGHALVQLGRRSYDKRKTEKAEQAAKAEAAKQPAATDAAPADEPGAKGGEP